MQFRLIYIIAFLFHFNMKNECKGQQPLILFDKEHQIAKINYTRGGKRISAGYDENKTYPANGAYTPTSYSNGILDIKPNTGFCNYVYIPTEGKLKPGQQYTIKIEVKLDEAYNDMPFYQDHFGIALTSYNYPNKFPDYWGLLEHTFEPLYIQTGGKIVSIEKEFRPLCSSKYIFIGVFEGETPDPLSCFFCFYPFEVHSVSVSESKNPEVSSEYFCDDFKEEPPSQFSKFKASIYFESGSSEIDQSFNPILDSVVARINTLEEVPLISAHTDISGTNNELLGEARNQSVVMALEQRGVDKSKILRINNSDDFAAEEISDLDRRVDINLIGSELYKKDYTEGINAAQSGDFATAYKLIIKRWIYGVPSERSIYALFDCWGEGAKADRFKEDLLNAIKENHYPLKDLKFKLDSLECEWRKGKYMKAHLTTLRATGIKHNCSFISTPERDAHLRKEVDLIYQNFKFPSKKKVGASALNTMPKIILTSDDIEYLKEYLPRIEHACKEMKVQWKYYAELYDKISILRIGTQRYGTRMIQNYQGQLVPEFPLANLDSLDEYRRQVKLAPFNTTHKKAISESLENLDSKLAAVLNKVYQDDQHYRNQINEWNRDFRFMRQSDSINQIKVTEILDRHGWLGPDVVGHRGNQALFLVIQHADLEMQIKYLPMLKEAVREGKAHASQLALLEDRVSLKQEGLQIYGSQILTHPDSGDHYVAPIKDPNLVNIRRAEVGLGTIEDYVKRWGIEWNLDHHMRHKPKINQK